jgi:hypothetical protein
MFLYSMEIFKELINKKTGSFECLIIDKCQNN